MIIILIEYTELELKRAYAAIYDRERSETSCFHLLEQWSLCEDCTSAQAGMCRRYSFKLENEGLYLLGWIQYNYIASHEKLTFSL